MQSINQRYQSPNIHTFTSSSPFNVRCPCSHKLRWFLHLTPLHLTRFRPILHTNPIQPSPSSHSHPKSSYPSVYPFKILDAESQLLRSYRSTWPIPSSLLRLTLNTYVMHSITTRLLSSALAVQLFKQISHVHHLTIIRFILSHLAIFSIFKAHVSLTYRSSIPFLSLWVAQLDVSTGASSLNFAQAQHNPALDVSSVHSPASTEITEHVHAFQLTK